MSKPKYEHVSMSFVKLIDEETINNIMVRSLRGKVGTFSIDITTPDRSEVENLSKLIEMDIWHARIVIASTQEEAPFLSLEKLSDRMRLIEPLKKLSECSGRCLRYSIVCGRYKFAHKNGITYGIGDNWHSIGGFDITKYVSPVPPGANFTDFLH